MTTEATPAALRLSDQLGVSAPGRDICDYEAGDEDWLDDDPACERCRGDGMDPWIDYLMPCPACQGEQR